MCTYLDCMSPETWSGVFLHSTVGFSLDRGFTVLLYTVVLVNVLLESLYLSWTH